MTNENKQAPDQAKPSVGDPVFDNLRLEASEVKQCATRYMMRGLTVSVPFLGAIIGLLPQYPLAGFAGVIIIPFMNAILYIILHKYATANRVLGYQLHLEYLLRGPNRKQLGTSADLMLQVGWEEAMLAWRTVQSSVYDALYKENKLTGGKALKKESKEADYQWYLPKELIKNAPPKKAKPNPSEAKQKNSARYYPGRYLQQILKGPLLVNIIALMTYSFSLALLILNELKILSLNLSSASTMQASEYPVGIIACILAALIWLIFALVAYRGWDRSKKKRRNLEEELLCIDSCALMWRAVSVAHCATYSKLESEGEAGLMGYTYELGQLAAELCAEINNIQHWINKKAQQINQNTSAKQKNPGDNDTQTSAPESDSIRKDSSSTKAKSLQEEVG